MRCGADGVCKSERQHHTSAASTATRNTKHAATSTIPRWSQRWKPHSRMLYLRHMAYRAAISERVAYRHFLYVREDNAFLEPPAALAAFAASHFATPPTESTAADGAVARAGTSDPSSGGVVKSAVID